MLSSSPPAVSFGDGEHYLVGREGEKNSFFFGVHAAPEIINLAMKRERERFLLDGDILFILYYYYFSSIQLTQFKSRIRKWCLRLDARVANSSGRQRGKPEEKTSQFATVKSQNLSIGYTQTFKNNARSATFVHEMCQLATLPKRVQYRARLRLCLDRIIFFAISFSRCRCQHCRQRDFFTLSIVVVVAAAVAVVVAFCFLPIFCT